MPSVTRSNTVLGKRPHAAESSTPASTDTKQQLQTPDNTPNPKRPRTSGLVLDGDGNKENIPPFVIAPLPSPASPRAARALRRSSTLDGSPTRSRQGVVRRASTSLIPGTPTAEIAQLTLVTPPPTPPTILLPIYARARALLRSTCNSPATDMTGREAEHALLSAFFSTLVQDAPDVEQTSLYISGSPGTGKTALVNSILRDLDVQQVKVITINCMALNSLDVLWDRLIEELGGNKDKKKGGNRMKKVQGRETVEALLAASSTKRIIFLDELDHIAPTAQTLTSLFSLSASRPSTLRVVGIANTHTLTASSATGFVPTSSNVSTIHFPPYTPAQLLSILQSRLAPLYAEGPGEDEEEAKRASEEAKKFLSPNALTLLSKKVAALTGDVRSLFEVLRGAIDLAVAAQSAPSPTRSESNPLNPAVKLTVAPSHILAALKAHSVSSHNASKGAPANSEIVSKIRSLGLQARLVLLALLLATKRLEAGLRLSTTAVRSSATDPAQLHAFYTSIMSRSGDGMFSAVSRSEFNDLIGMLEGLGLVVCASPAGLPGAVPQGAKAKRAFGRSSSFTQGANRSGGGASDVQLAAIVRHEELLRGLGIDETEMIAEDVAVEEINAIWVKETARLTREMAAKVKTTKEKVVAGFEDAMEP
ncbi:unnamed protein product [Mycena citricolor]|uniref:AAA+ ATPase domain-containing protein n=1 Tax=Mycena citricolor TaxID=2018698 RepID=A0AAD2HS29_9AGAR|nr:unnamed protein product [Mycena citricolor]